MADVTTVRYRGTECSHINEVEFVGREPFEEKTRGCSRCGLTSKFVKDNSILDDTMTVKHSEDSDLKPGQDDESTNDHATARDSLNELDYRELQSIASETSVQGNIGEEDMIEELASLETDKLTNAIETGLEDE